jgi:nicotinamidase-related amidase
MQKIASRIDPNDTTLLLIDLQVGIVELSKTISVERLKKGVFGLSRLAKIFGMPTIVSGVAGQDGTAPRMLPQIGDGVGEFTVCQRTMADSLRNEAIVSILQASNRRTLLISGVSTEVAVQLPALTAADLGFRVLVVIDACGGMSERTEQAALQRISKSGGAMVSVMTLAGELCGDFRAPEAQPAIDILYEMATA